MILRRLVVAGRVVANVKIVVTLSQAGVECQRVNDWDIRSDGRWIPDVIEGSDFVIDAEVVVFSIGQKSGLSFIPSASGISVNPNQTLNADPDTYATDRPGVFAAGDTVSGTAFVIEAVASGSFSKDVNISSSAWPRPSSTTLRMSSKGKTVALSCSSWSAAM